MLTQKQRGALPPYEQAIAKTKQMFLATWEQSRTQAWRNNVKHNCNLFEHYYKREPTHEELKVKLSKAQRSITTFYECGFLESLEGLSPEAYVAVDELDSFDFEGIRVFAVPDFAVHKDSYELYDWKTGKPSDNDVLQLSCYALYAQAKWQAVLEHIRIIPVYLAQEDFAVSPSSIIAPDEVKVYMRGSIGQMKSCLFDISANKADEQKMFRTTEAWRCKNCKFQEICL